MYSVVIVDDEPQVRRGLEKLVRLHSEDWNIIGVFVDGIEALHRTVDFASLDLMITDIKMPHIDGLELIRRMRERYPQMQIVIISGFNEFEFAQKALKYSVISYLLKPLDTEELYNVLDEVQHNLSILQRSHDQLSDVERQSYHEFLLRDVLRQGNSHPWLTGGTEDHFLALLATFQQSVLQIDRPYRVITIKCLNQSIDIDSLLTSLQRKLVPFEGAAFRFSLIYCVAILLRSEYAVCRQITDALLQESKDPLSIGISSVCQKDYELPFAYRQSYLAANLSLYEYKKHVYLYGEQGSEDFVKFEDDKLRNLINAGNTLEASNYIDTTFALFAEKKTYIDKLDLWIANVLNCLTERMEENGIEQGANQKQILILHSLDSAFTIEEIHKATLFIVKRVSTMMGMIADKKRTKKIDSILAYIKSNYNKDLSLDEIADAVSLNPSYISYLFKTQTNSTLIDYIAKLRIDRAKDLLQNSDQKIFQIADSIGYHDARYFNRIFKKNTGVTPKEYRHFSQIG